MRQDDPFVSRRGVLTGPAGLSSSAIADKGGQFILIDALGVRAHTDGEDTIWSRTSNGFRRDTWIALGRR